MLRNFFAATRLGCSELRSLSALIGLLPAILYQHHKRLGKRCWIRPRAVAHHLCVRRDSSDIDVFKQIFLEREYSCLDDLTDVKLVIDCGANVGYSSAYFLSRFPDCQVLAIEPDPENFAVLAANLAAYGPRAQLFQAAIWSHSCQLAISPERYRDGRDWSRQVTACVGAAGAAQETVPGIGLSSLISGTRFDRVSILKMDIEGAEAMVFADGCQAWLDKVDAIAIELHDDTCFGSASEVFFSAISPAKFHMSNCGELVVCKRAPVNHGGAAGGR